METQAKSHTVRPIVRFHVLPCPFCGSEAALRSCLGEHWIGCDNKECQFDTDFYSTPEMAVEIWNDSARCHGNKSNGKVHDRPTAEENSDAKQ